MKNYKRLFIFIFTLLLTFMSVFTISFYDNVKENIQISEEDVLEQFQEELPYFILAKAMEVDENYQPLSFAKNVPSEVQAVIKEALFSRIREMSVLFDQDKNFIYLFENNKTMKSISSNIQKIRDDDEQPEDFYLYLNMFYDENGTLFVEKENESLYHRMFDQFNVDDFISERYVVDIYENNDIYYGEISDIDQLIFDSVNSHQVSIHMPQNLNIGISIPKDLHGRGFVTNQFKSLNWYGGYPALALCVGTIILVLFMLFYPIRVVEEVNPFQMIKKWKAEFNFVWLACALTGMVFGCLFVSAYTINGFFADVLQNYLANSTEVLLLLNFIVWLLTFYLISLALFEIKYMFAHGFIRFLKEDTLIGAIFSWIKRTFHKIADIDLTQPINRQVFKFVIFHTVIILICVSFWGFGYIPAIIYTFVMFFWLNNKITQISKDHEAILAMTKELAQGHFDLDVKQELGIFDPLKEELQNIKTGFEKAVQEETKSQNMKTELISHVSHDLKTPLTCIKNYIVLLEDENLTLAQREEYLKNVNQYVNRLNTLIEDLFEVSKVNSGNIQLDLMDLNIVALIEQTKAEYEELLAESDLTIIPNISSPEIWVHLDSGKTYRIFENLFTNIGKYAMKHSRVYIDVKENEEDVIIEFKNISAVQMNFTSDEIVERFVRGDKSRHESGSGLGLAIVQSFTEIQGGTLRIEIDGDLFKSILTFKKVVKHEMIQQKAVS